MDNNNKKVIVDALGGDNGYTATLGGAVLALKCDSELNLLLIGDETEIKNFKGMAEFLDRVEILHTTTNIGMKEQPTVAIRQKPDASICLGMDALRKREDCMAILSAGSTGAVLTGAIMKVGRIEGVSRPSLTPAMMTRNVKNNVYVFDVGANMDCKAINLVHFSLMADVYLKEKGIENPRLGLLSIGAEKEKGNELNHEVYPMLEKLHSEGHINFVGNIEANNIYNEYVDGIICDGFSGNIMLKTLEGTIKLMANKMKGAINLPSKILSICGLKKMKRNLLDATAVGAVFLGIKKPVIKVHGHADAETVRRGIIQAKKAGEMNLEQKISAKIANAGVDA